MPRELSDLQQVDSVLNNIGVYLTHPDRGSLSFISRGWLASTRNRVWLYFNPLAPTEVEFKVSLL